MPATRPEPSISIGGKSLSDAVRDAFLNLYGGIVPISPAGRHQPDGKENKALPEKLSQERVTP